MSGTFPLPSSRGIGLPDISTYFTLSVELLASRAALAVFLSALGVTVTFASNTAFPPSVALLKSLPITSDVEVTCIPLNVSPVPGVTTTLYVP